MCPLCQDSRHTLSQCKRWMMKAALARNAATASQGTAPYPPELLAIVQGTEGLNSGQNSQQRGSDVRDS